MPAVILAVPAPRFGKFLKGGMSGKELVCRFSSAGPVPAILARIAPRISSGLPIGFLKNRQDGRQRRPVVPR